MTIASIDNVDVVAGVPVSGLIFMWHGTLANIPAGYVLCDGNNSTPNLIDQFVIGVATAATDPGATGGSTSKVSTSHTHTSGNHRHYVTTTSAGGGSTAMKNLITGGYFLVVYAHGHYGYTGYATPGGMSGATENWTDGRPKYYEVAFIMKT